MTLLVEIPKSKWKDLRDLYKIVWPDGAVAYCALDTLITNPTLSCAINFKVYCPDGELSNGMVAILNSFGYYQILVHPVKDVAKLEEALQNTTIIDWKRGVVVASASSTVVECFKRLQKHLGIIINDDPKANKYVLGKAEYDLSCSPSHSYVASLKPEHISLIDKTWTYHGEHTYKFFETLMSHEMTYVLYSSTDDKPMAWITVDTAGALTHLYTVEQYRRRGYGEFITKYAAKDIIRKGRTVIAYTIEGNEKPKRLFEKLGFDVIGTDYWLYLSRV